MPSSQLPPAVAHVAHRWLDAHDRVAPGVVEGLYLVGSAALGDWRPTSDVDIVAFTADPTDVEVVEALERAHHAFLAAHDGATVDGPVLGWADVAAPPLAAQRAWTLAGEFRFDGDCFEINPVTWFTLAEHGVAVRGPHRRQLGVHLDAAERRSWVRENVDTYWRTVLEQVRVAHAERDAAADDGALVEWCVLGVARMWFTVETGAVASKSDAGAWAAERLLDHAPIIDLALAVRSGAVVADIDRSVVRSVADAMAAMIDAVV